MGATRTRDGAHFAAVPASVRAARRLVRDALIRAGRGDLVDDSELLVSEIASNALVHAGTEFDITVDAGPHGVRVEVADGSPHHPLRRDYSELAGTGRGVRLLEQLVDRWGTDPGPSGKTVWFELSAPRDAPGTTAGARGPGSTGRPDTVEVVLIDTPLLLHAAWQMHAESLLREYLLVRLEDDDPVAQIEAHAAAGDAMTLLREHVPPVRWDTGPEHVLTASEPAATAPRLVLPVPVGSVPHFRLLSDMLDAALELARQGALLTAPMQPELSALRRWFCHQVTAQSAGTEPVPWDSSPLAVEPREAPTAWDSASVDDAGTALLAADDTNQIVAVSRAALDLLGHPDRSTLVGHRLVEVVPPDLRQAHLAGFSLHLLIGRASLLGHPVTVPVLRHDGSQVLLELTIEAHRLVDGRGLFIAEMRGVAGSGVGADVSVATTG